MSAARYSQHGTGPALRDLESRAKIAAPPPVASPGSEVFCINRQSLIEDLNIQLFLGNQAFQADILSL